MTIFYRFFGSVVLLVANAALGAQAKTEILLKSAPISAVRIGPVGSFTCAEH